MYGMLVKWVNPNESDIQLIHDFERIEHFSEEMGAISTELHITKNKEYLIIQLWPSKKYYDAMFNERKFKYMERVPEDIKALLDKIEDYYKIQYLEEFESIK